MLLFIHGLGSRVQALETTDLVDVVSSPRNRRHQRTQEYRKSNNTPGGYQHRLLVWTIFRENLPVVDGPSQTVHCLEDDLFMATPAWPTPMRALISKLNLSHVPEHLNASLTAHCSTGGLEELSPASRRAHSTSLLGALAAGSSADPPPRATAQTLRGSNSDEVMVVRATLVLARFRVAVFRVTTNRCPQRGSRRHPTTSYGAAAPVPALRSITW